MERSNLVRVLTDSAARSPERPALRLGTTTMTYQQLDDATARCAGLLRAHGMQPGDCVGLMMPNVPYFAVCYYAVLRAGGVVVPMNVLLKEREVRFYLEDSGAKLMFAWGEMAGAAQVGSGDVGAQCLVVRPGEFEQTLAGSDAQRDVVDVAPEATAVVLYTSGTTGQPKGAELTHANLYTNAAVTADTLGHFTCDDVLLGALPLFHAFGQTCALNAAMYAGASLSLLPRFDPGQALEIIHRDRVTVFEGVPTMFGALVHHGDRDRYDTSSLRLCISGGAAIPVEVIRQFEQAFGSMVLEGYGLSETSPVASFNHPDRPRKAGSIGTPVKGVEMKVGDDDGTPLAPGQVGQIFIRGHNVMKGYWNRPDATAEAMKDGWFATGDMARQDEDGYYFIVDRKKDMIIRGGYNVYPREIEEVLHEHPDVQAAAVVGIPDERLGEEVGAAVVPKPGHTIDVEELRQFAKSQVAGYKYPRVIWVVDDLPKGPTGKVLKREITVPEAAEVTR